MSLFGTIQQSNGALQAMQIGLQVAGNNISNANTEGYIRQEINLTPASAFRNGNLIQGHGVRVTGITQAIDKALAERMFQANTAAAGGETLEKAYNQLEELAQELDGNGLNNQLSEFNNALHELSTQPADQSVRDFVVLQGEALAGKLRTTREQALDRQQAWNADLAGIATQINRLTERISRLNTEIATIEGGGLLGSDATGLRDQRYQDLEELAGYIDINIQEQSSGNVNVFVGGDYLVSNGSYREVYSVYDEGEGGQEVRIRETDSPLDTQSGILAATVEARNSVFGDYIDELDDVASALIRSVNEIHTQGQGRKGFDEVTSAYSADTGVPLVSAGLPFTPSNGSFDVQVVDDDNDLISTQRIQVRRLGQIGDSTVQSIVQDLNAIDGIDASITSDGRVHLESSSPSSSFTFSDDTSGFLASVGLNTFFVGEDAGNIEVNSVIRQDSSYLSVSKTGIGQDTDALIDLVDLVDRPLDHLDGRSVRGVYEQTVNELGQKISLQKSTTEAQRNFYATLQSQHLATTGVNLDEEAIKMIAYQRAFQASSRVITTANEMLDILVNL